tara:strand:+ start:1161 stop:1544 length:384 start_codon:yes stop_codon:yes gene_type:complete
MWFDIIKYSDAEIQALMDDLGNAPNTQALRNEIEMARAELTQPLMEQEIEITDPLNALKPIEEVLGDLTPKEEQQIKNTEWWLTLQRRNPKLHAMAMTPPKTTTTSKIPIHSAGKSPKPPFGLGGGE